MAQLSDGLRIAVLAAALLAGSCTSDIDEGGKFSSDGAANHPIVVEPSTRALKLPFSAGEAGLMPEDAARLEAFVGDYLSNGNGAISISAPEGADSNAAISYFGERLAQMGVPRSRILVGTHESAGHDGAVELDFISYAAHTDKCGDWSQDLAATQANDTSPDFGCSVQQNIAAMVADPRDLMGSRPVGPADATRRGDVVGKYEKGAITQADKNKTDKTNEQSGAASAAGGSD
jgi:pilus assembly protein CpaD